MIFGEYPCCDGGLFLYMPDQTPAYAPEDCPHCGAPVWHEFMRSGPRTWLAADFLAAFDVDEVSRTIRRKAA